MLFILVEFGEVRRGGRSERKPEGRKPPTTSAV